MAEDNRQTIPAETLDALRNARQSASNIRTNFLVGVSFQGPQRVDTFALVRIVRTYLSKARRLAADYPQDALLKGYAVEAQRWLDEVATLSSVRG